MTWHLHYFFILKAIENEVDNSLSNNQVSEFTRSNSFAVVRVLLQACIQETGIEMYVLHEIQVWIV